MLCTVCYIWYGVSCTACAVRVVFCIVCQASTSVKASGFVISSPFSYDLKLLQSPEEACCSAQQGGRSGVCFVSKISQFCEEGFHHLETEVKFSLHCGNTLCW